MKRSKEVEGDNWTGLKKIKTLVEDQMALQKLPEDGKVKEPAKDLSEREKNPSNDDTRRVNDLNDAMVMPNSGNSCQVTTKSDLVTGESRSMALREENARLRAMVGQMEGHVARLQAEMAEVEERTDFFLAKLGINLTDAQSKSEQ